MKLRSNKPKSQTPFPTSSLEISENILNTEPVKTAEPTSMLSTKNLDEHDSVSTINSENSLPGASKIYIRKKVAKYKKRP